MSPLSARAHALVERAQKEAAPSEQELSHLRARLTTSLAKQSPDPVLLPFSLSKLAGVLAVAAVGLGAWHLRGMLAAHDPQGPGAAVPVLAQPTEAPVSCPPVPTCAPPVAEPARAQPLKGVACAPPRKRSEEEWAPAPSRALKQGLFSVEAAARDPSLELQLLILARDALNEDRSMDALAHALRHEELYPTSAFEEERLAIEVLAYCASGRTELAAQPFARLIEVAPRTMYLPRVRGTCGPDFGPAAGTSEAEP